MFQLLSKLYFLQTLLARVVSWLMPPFLVHNLGKYFALKKSFYLIGLEELEGDYVEFGVFTGSSMSAAVLCSRYSRADKKIERKFLGYDSFDGFGDLEDGDKHPFYTEINFKTDYDSVSKRLNSLVRKDRFNKVELVKGFFSETLDGHKLKEDYGVEKVAIALIDNDTYGGAKSAFNILEESLQLGTILLLDDYYSYKGSNKKGVRGAFLEWAKDSRFECRFLSGYGMGGAVYIISGKKDS